MKTRTPNENPNASEIAHGALEREDKTQEEPGLALAINRMKTVLKKVSDDEITAAVRESRDRH